MGAVSELYAMRRSVSADMTVKHQSRSGDDQEGGAVLLDFLANVQSAEADIIEAEEREEQAESKRQFVRLLRLYFKKILSDQERKFLAECLRSGQTPYKVGRAMGLDYRTVIESVQSKHAASAPRLAALMRAVGMRGAVQFFPKLAAAVDKADYDRVYYQRTIYRQKTTRRIWYENNRAEVLEKNRARYAATYERKTPKRTAEERREYWREYQRRYKREHYNPERKKAQNANYQRKRAGNDPEWLERERERKRLDYQAHAEERNAKRREKRRLEKERREREQEKARQSEQSNA